ncbi:MAG: ArsA-related P-loop ATPase [Acidimicrobiales bacterium]
MKTTAFCTQARVLIVAGKGGVGKTTVAAALAWMAATAGLDALVVEVEGTGGLPRLLGHPGPLTYDEVVLAGDGFPAPPEAPGGPVEAPAGRVRARALSPDGALVEYLESHGLRRISRRLSSSGTLDVVATGVPGIKDILVLGKVKALERAGAAGEEGAPDLIVVDGPAAGHAVQFLTSASGLLDAAGGGPIRSQAADVVGLLGDPERCQVVLVTIPEETPVNEVVETAFLLEDRAGVKLGPVVVNCLYPTLDLVDDPGQAARQAGVSMHPDELEVLGRAAAFRRRRQDLQARQVARLGAALPLPTLELRQLFSADLGPADVATLAADLAAGVGALATTIR